MKKDAYGRKVEQRSNGVIATEVVPIKLEITCYSCSNVFQKTLDFSLEYRTSQAAYCDKCDAVNKVTLPAANNFPPSLEEKHAYR